MGWLDLGHFALEMEEIIGRRAEFNSIPPRTSKKCIRALNGIEAYRLDSGY